MPPLSIHSRMGWEKYSVTLPYIIPSSPSATHQAGSQLIRLLRDAACRKPAPKDRAGHGGDLRTACRGIVEAMQGEASELDNLQDPFQP